MHFIGKIKVEAHTTLHSHKNALIEIHFLKKIFKLFVAYGKVPWA